MDGHPESNMAFEHGKPVSVELTDGTSLRGFVHAEDKAAGLVCLELIPSSDVTLLSTCNVKSVATISDLSESRKWPANPVIDISRLRAEQERVFRKRHHKYTRIGVGVSAGAQAIFDMIDKTLPCEWADKVIVILKTVRLAPPYNVKSISGDPGVIQRVKIILEREAERLRSAADTNGEL